MLFYKTNCRKNRQVGIPFAAPGAAHFADAFQGLGSHLVAQSPWFHRQRCGTGNDGHKLPLSDNSIVEKHQAVDMAKQGQIAGVGIAHRGDTEYLKSIPDGSENNNLGNLPSVSP